MIVSTAYAVVYRPQSDGTWTAELADFPEVTVKGADIDEVKDRIRASGRRHIKTFGAQVPAGQIVVAYVHLDDRPTDRRVVPTALPIETTDEE